MSAQPKRKRIYISSGRPRGRPRKPRPVAPPAPPLAPAPAPPPITYRVKQAAAACGFSVSYMKRRVAEGWPRGPRSITKGRMVLIFAEDLREWLERGT
jgi:hypothetical protein